MQKKIKGSLCKLERGAVLNKHFLPSFWIGVYTLLPACLPYAPCRSLFISKTIHLYKLFIHYKLYTILSTCTISPLSESHTLSVNRCSLSLTMIQYTNKLHLLYCGFKRSYDAFIRLLTHE